MRLAVTGGSGMAGRFIVRGALAAGHEVTLLGRSPPQGLPGPVGWLPYDLDGPVPELTGQDALIHAALDHLPGRYRGGEGGDPAAFLRRNLDGTLRLFDAAGAVPRLLFLSSRAVLDGHPPGTRLTEDLASRPTSLYGRVKASAEAALQQAGAGRASLRVTGIYGPAPSGRAHKWQTLFDDFAAGRPVAPHVATEVHGDDLAAAVHLLLRVDPAQAAGVFNVSDIVLDRRDLLAALAALTGIDGPLPDRADAAALSVLVADRLAALGWRPRGMAGLAPALAAMLAEGATYSNSDPSMPRPVTLS